MKEKNKKTINQDLINSALSNKKLTKIAKSNQGQKFLLNKAITMLAKQRPDLTETQLKEIQEAAATGGLDALDNKLAEYDILK